jgi:HlyD family secretion protein
MKLKFTKKRLLIVAAALLAVTAVVGFTFWNSRTKAASYMTAKAEKGNIKNAVSATGTLQAVTTVQVGSQVSGNISELFVDFNSVVKKGQVVAQLDPAIFQAQLQSARANLDQARADYANAQAQLLSAKAAVQTQRAGVSGASANLAALKAQRDDAASLYERQKTLSASGLIPDRDLDVAKTSFQAAEARYSQAAAQLDQAKVGEQDSAGAGLAAANAQVQTAAARIKQNEAAVKLAEVNLSHTTISSPISGVVVSRTVDVGQTVAASMTAPTLFTIANDLTRMQVIANIDQADIGMINQSNRAAFTVDAYPGQTFDGTINQIRLNSVNVSNVVTYNVVIDVHNPDLKLKPGMTANLTMTVAERNNVLKVPNSALRFRPTGMSQEEMREAMRAAGVGGEGGRRRGQQEQAGEKTGDQSAPPAGQEAKPSGKQAAKPAANNAGGDAQAERGQRREGERNRGFASANEAVLEGQTRIVWVLGPDQKPQARKIKVGITDGSITEVAEGNLNEGETLIVGQNVTSENRPQQQLPGGFGGGIPGGGRGGGGGGGGGRR